MSLADWYIGFNSVPSALDQVGVYHHHAHPDSLHPYTPGHYGPPTMLVNPFEPLPSEELGTGSFQYPADYYPAAYGTDLDMPDFGGLDLSSYMLTDMSGDGGDYSAWSADADPGFNDFLAAIDADNADYSNFLAGQALDSADGSLFMAGQAADSGDLAGASEFVQDADTSVADAGSLMDSAASSYDTASDMLGGDA
jgi:hypothetical protein